MMDITGMATWVFNLTQQDLTQAVILWVLLTFYLVRKLLLTRLWNDFPKKLIVVAAKKIIKKTSEEK